MKKFTLWLTAIMMSFTLGGAVVTAGFSGERAVAACSKNGSFLGFSPWYRGIQNDDCSIKGPGSADGDLAKYIWTIVLNIIDDMLRVVGFACVAFIIYGGFKYMTSTGSSDGMSKAKTTILNALIGLGISVASVAVVNLVVGSFQ